MADVLSVDEAVVVDAEVVDEVVVVVDPVDCEVAVDAEVVDAAVVVGQSSRVGGVTGVDSVT